MSIQLQEVTLEHNALCQALGACQRKCLGLKQEVGNQQKALEEALTKAIEAKKECLNSVEDIKCYHQTLIDMKEHYRRDVEAFVKVTP
jgi:Mg2+ and Co2+ transporter CorA